MSKIEQQIQDAFATGRQQNLAGRLGVIASYNAIDNTATVLISGENTDVIEDILNGVMCPVQLGIQTVAPSPGRECWVVFKNNNISQPLITHYYNHKYSQYDYSKQTQANIGLPNYLLGL